MDLNKVFQSKFFYGTIFGILAVIILLVVFRMGMVVGFREAVFSYQWGENYHQNFAGPKRGFMHSFTDRDFTEAHGAFGQIIKVDNSSLVIKGKDNIEKVISVSSGATINKFNTVIKLADLKVDDNVVVIGEPDSTGKINAKFIRVLPPLPGSPVGQMPLEPDQDNFPSGDSLNTNASTVTPAASGTLPAGR